MPLRQMHSKAAHDRWQQLKKPRVAGRIPRRRDGTVRSIRSEPERRDPTGTHSPCVQMPAGAYAQEAPGGFDPAQLADPQKIVMLLIILSVLLVARPGRRSASGVVCAPAPRCLAAGPLLHLQSFPQVHRLALGLLHADTLLLGA